jgi:hypothetical protein
LFLPLWAPPRGAIGYYGKVQRAVATAFAAITHFSSFFVFFLGYFSPVFVAMPQEEALLPPEWTKQLDPPTGKYYYFNKITGASE